MRRNRSRIFLIALLTMTCAGPKQQTAIAPADISEFRQLYKGKFLKVLENSAFRIEAQYYLASLYFVNKYAGKEESGGPGQQDGTTQNDVLNFKSNENIIVKVTPKSVASITSRNSLLESSRMSISGQDSWALLAVLMDIHGKEIKPLNVIRTQDMMEGYAEQFYLVFPKQQNCRGDLNLHIKEYRGENLDCSFAWSMDTTILMPPELKKWESLVCGS